MTMTMADLYRKHHAEVAPCGDKIIKDGELFGPYSVLSAKDQWAYVAAVLDMEDPSPFIQFNYRGIWNTDDVKMCEAAFYLTNLRIWILEMIMDHPQFRTADLWHLLADERIWNARFRERLFLDMESSVRLNRQPHEAQHVGQD